MKFIRYILYFFLFVLVAVAGLLIYVKTGLPNAEPVTDVKIEYTPERIARGAYLANSVMVCMDCHSTRDWTKFSGPLADGTLGRGGERFDQKVGLPGVYISKNITPEGISRYTDGELFRLITTGVTKEGRAIFPLMPYYNYGRTDPDDIYSVIAYVRSLAPIKNEVPDSQSDFPMNFIINTLPQKAEPTKRPDPSDVLAYGAYMTNASGCKECHTRVERGQIIPELVFSGGREFTFPNGATVRSANITFDPTSGIGKWSEEAFVQRFKMFGDSTYKAIDVGPGDFNTIMPWTMYAKMERKDLVAIYTYLKSVAPMVNEVEKYTPAK